MIKIHMSLSTHKATCKLEPINEIDLVGKDEDTIKALTKAFEEFLRADNEVITTYNEENGLRFRWFHHEI